MKIDEKTTIRLDELVNIGDSILQNKVLRPAQSSGRGVGYPSYYKIDGEQANQWRMNCLQILENIFTRESAYYSDFKKNSDHLATGAGHSQMKKSLAFFKAAKDDYEKGFIPNPQEKSVIQEVLESQINIQQTKEACNLEAKRNSRIYLVFILTILIFVISIFYYFFGLIVTGIVSLSLAIIGFIISCLLLKEITFSKLPERLVEYEKDRLYKRFEIESNK